MGVIAFGFDKLLVERKKPIELPMKVDTAIKITDVKEEDFPLAGGRKEKILRFLYRYDVEYQPKQAFIQIEGHLLYHEPKDALEKIAKRLIEKETIEKEYPQIQIVDFQYH